MSIQRPSTVDVSVANPNNTVYISDGTFTAGELTEKSVRFILGNDGIVHLERRISSVWNRSKLEHAGTALLALADNAGNILVDSKGDIVERNFVNPLIP